MKIVIDINKTRCKGSNGMDCPFLSGWGKHCNRFRVDVKPKEKCYIPERCPECIALENKEGLNE